MQQINLYRPIFRKQEKKFSSLAMAQASAAILAGIVIIYGLMYWQVFSLRDDLKQAEQRLVAANRQLDDATRKLGVAAPGKTLDEEVAQLQKQIASRLHVRDVLDALATRHPGLLHKFGGHAMAAGLTLERGRYNDFAAAFDEEVSRWLNDDDLRGTVLSDGELSAADFTLDLAQSLRDAGPWGAGFPEPIFDGTFNVVDHRIVGQKHLKLTLRPSGGGRAIDAIAFGAAEVTVARDARVHAAFRLDVNEYLGNRSVQLVVEHLEPVG